jgi:hypothetical protein
MARRLRPSRGPLASRYPPLTLDAGVGERLRLVRDLSDERVAEPPRYSGARRVRAIVVDLHQLDLRHAEGGIGQQPHRCRHHTAAGEVDVQPVADLEPIETEAAVQATTARDPLRHEDAVETVSAISPLLLPAGE